MIFGCFDTICYATSILITEAVHSCTEKFLYSSRKENDRSNDIYILRSVEIQKENLEEREDSSSIPKLLNLKIRKLSEM